MAPVHPLGHVPDGLLEGDALTGKAPVKLHKHGDAANLYIPRSIVGDTAFPFKEHEWKDLMVEISGRCLILRPRREGD